jgi:hypothetical protein
MSSYQMTPNPESKIHTETTDITATSIAHNIAHQTAAQCLWETKSQTVTEGHLEPHTDRNHAFQTKTNPYPRAIAARF